MMLQKCLEDYNQKIMDKNEIEKQINIELKKREKTIRNKNAIEKFLTSTS